MPAPDAVIHDIGYRHYDGPRLGQAALVRALFVEGLRGAYGIGRSTKSRIVPRVLLALTCIPALIWGLVVSIINLPSLPVGYVEYIFVGQVVVAIYLASQAPALVSRDLRHRVVSLYFSRPLGRMQYVFARYAALVVAVVVLLATPLTVLFIGAMLGELPLGEQLPEYLRGLAAAVLAAVLLSGIALVIAAFTTRRGLGVAAIVTVLLLAAGVHAFVLAVAKDVGADRLEAWSAIISPFALVDAIAGNLLRADTNFVPDPSWALGAGLAAVWIGMVAACCAALALRYRTVAVS